MADKSVGMDYSIGHVRMKYLDFANMSFAQGNYIQCRGYIEDFLDTVKEESDAGKAIKFELDKIYDNKKKIVDAVEKKIKEMGYLESKDFEDNAKSELEINTIHDMKEICWRVSLRDGLFNE